MIRGFIMFDRIAFCYWPTTVFVIDDDEDFLKLLKDSLDSKGALCRTFSDAEDCLEELKQAKQPKKIINDYLTSDNAKISEEDNLLLPIDLSNVYSLSYRKDRFSDVATIIVDYRMHPTGPEFIKQLKDLDINLKIIILTAYDDKEKGLALFNDKQIDGFIVKGGIESSEKLEASLKSLSLSYFHEASMPFINLLDQKDHCFKNKKFVEFFGSVIDEQNIVEFYAIDNEGSFLLINKKGELRFLLVKSDLYFDDYCAIAEDQDAPSALVDQLKNKEKIPFFLGNSVQATIHDWNQYLHDAKPIEGVDQYYYSLVSNLSGYEIDSVFSLQDYRKK